MLMDRNPILDQGSPRLVPQAPPPEGESPLSLLDSARATLRFPGPNESSSLTEMAQRDLNATLQLLAERAQYITGASGAAIALWEGERWFAAPVQVRRRRNWERACKSIPDSP